MYSWTPQKTGCLMMFVIHTQNIDFPSKKWKPNSKIEKNKTNHSNAIFHQIWVPHMNVEASSGGVKTRKPFRLRSNYVLVFFYFRIRFQFLIGNLFFLMDHQHHQTSYFPGCSAIELLKVSRHLGLPPLLLRKLKKNICRYRCWWANGIVYIIVYIAEMY